MKIIHKSFTLSLMIAMTFAMSGCLPGTPGEESTHGILDEENTSVVAPDPIPDSAPDPEADNSAPTANNQNVSVHYPNGEAKITLTGADLESSTLTYTIVEQPKYGKLTGTAPNLVYIPDIIEVKVVEMDKKTTPSASAKTQSTSVASTIDKSTITDSKGDANLSKVARSPMEGPAPVKVPRYDSFTFKVNDGTQNSAIATVSITRTRSLQTHCEATDGTNKTSDMDMSYDSEGNLLESIVTYYNQDGSMNYKDKKSYTYDANSNLLTYIYESYGGISNALTSRQGSVSTYDAKGNLLSLTYLTDYNGDDTIDQKNITTNTYDSDNNMLTTKSESIDPATNTITGNYMKTYTYDGGKNILTEIYESDDGGDNIIDYRTTTANTYDSSGNMLTQLIERDYNADNTIDSRTLTTYTYDANNNRLTNIRDEDTNGDGNIDNRYTTTSTYDGNSNELTKINEQDSGADGSINYRNTETKTYDSNNNMLTRILDGDSSGDNVIEYRETYTHTYDSHNGQTSYKYENDTGADGIIEYSSQNLYSFTYDDYSNVLTSTTDDNGDETIDRTTACTWIEI
jgi:hypothetical protein